MCSHFNAWRQMQVWFWLRFKYEKNKSARGPHNPPRCPKYEIPHSYYLRVKAWYLKNVTYKASFWGGGKRFRFVLKFWRHVFFPINKAINQEKQMPEIDTSHESRAWNVSVKRQREILAWYISVRLETINWKLKFD